MQAYALGSNLLGFSSGKSEMSSSAVIGDNL